MPRYQVTLRQDAWLNHLAIVEAHSADAAVDAARNAWKTGVPSNIKFEEAGFSTFDAILVDPEDCELVDDAIDDGELSAAGFPESVIRAEQLADARGKAIRAAAKVGETAADAAIAAIDAKLTDLGAPATTANPEVVVVIFTVEKKP